MKTEERYDVVIYEKSTGKIDAIIGKDMKSWDGTGSGRNTAEFRVQTGQERINEHFDCMMVEAGKYQKGETIATLPVGGDSRKDRKASLRLPMFTHGF